jgi:hypothetical protein
VTHIKPRLGGDNPLLEIRDRPALTSIEAYERTATRGVPPPLAFHAGRGGLGAGRRLRPHLEHRERRSAPAACDHLIGLTLATRLLPLLLAGPRTFVLPGTNARSMCVPGREVNNDKVVRRVYEDLLRYTEVKPDLPQERYGAYDPSPVVSSRICLASSTNEAGTSTSLGPADRKSGASKPAARWISEGIPASFSTPSISSATDSSGAAANFTHLSSIRGFYPNGSMLGIQRESGRGRAASLRYVERQKKS